MGNDIETIEKIRAMHKLMETLLVEVRDIKAMIRKDKGNSKPKQEGDKA